MPKERGNWHTTYTRFQRWAASGVWQRVFEATQAEADLHTLLVDSTKVRAYLLADWGYDFALLVAALAARGTCVVVPPRHKRRTHDAARYAQRHPAERLFSRLKPFRRVATCYDKLDAHFLAFVHLAVTVLWLREC